VVGGSQGRETTAQLTMVATLAGQATLTVHI